MFIFAKKIFYLVLSNFGTIMPKASLFLRAADPKSESFAITYPLQGCVPRSFISISLSPRGDSIQVLPAVSFQKHERYRLSYRGWAPVSHTLFSTQRDFCKEQFSDPPPGALRGKNHPIGPSTYQKLVCVADHTKNDFKKVQLCFKTGWIFCGQLTF